MSYNCEKTLKMSYLCSWTRKDMHNSRLLTSFRCVGFLQPRRAAPVTQAGAFSYMLGARCLRRSQTETVPPNLCSRFGKFLSFSHSSSYFRLWFDWQAAIRFLTTFEIFFHRC